MSLHLTVRRGMATAVTAVVVLGLGVAGASAAPKPNLATVQKQVETLQHDVEAATEQYNGAREKLASVNVMTAAATTRVAQQRGQVEIARQGLGRLAAVTYKAGDLEMVSLMLSDDPDAAFAASGLHSSLSERQAEAVAALVAAQRRLAEDQAHLGHQKTQLVAETKRLQTLKKQIESKLADSRRLLAQLDGTQRRAIAQMGGSGDQRAIEQAGVEVPATGLLHCEDVGIDTTDAQARAALNFACAQIGKPYRWGGSGPGSYDCSGLAMAAYAKAGISLPHNAAMQAREGVSVSQANLKPGDLVFFNSYNHMGIYVGKGLMVHAPHTGDVIRIASARLDGRLIKAVRL